MAFAALAYLIDVFVLIYTFNFFLYTPQAARLRDSHYSAFFFIYVMIFVLRDVLAIGMVAWFCGACGMRERECVPLGRLSWKYVLWGVLGVFLFRVFAPPVMTWIMEEGVTHRFPTTRVAMFEPIRSLGISMGIAACLDNVLGPIYEEILYRGFLQTVFKKYMNGPLAVVTMSALFALSHWPVFGMSWWEFTQQFLMGLLFGVLREKSGMGPPIIAHQAKNFFVDLIAVHVIK